MLHGTHSRRQEMKLILSRRRLCVTMASGAALALLPLDVAAALAAENTAQPFTEAAFEAAQKAGKPILVDIYASWCDICARQKPILEKLRAEPKFKELVEFAVNFDTQRNVVRRFNARVQSTLICFHGTTETGRSVGETQPEWIEDLLSGTVKSTTT